MSSTLTDVHLVSFNVPYPPDYGGVIDVFYKIKWLAKAGIKVHLHTYQYGRPESKELRRLCQSVHYYKRKMYSDPFFSKLPYIVVTRNGNDLLNNLTSDNHPIIFEGIHCCYFLDHPALMERVKVVRMHNIEHIYYKNLARIEKNVFKKYFYATESRRLSAFVKVLHQANSIAAISPDDTRFLSLKYSNVFYLPVFHQNEKVNIEPGNGRFALYHGNLGVGENNQAALFLVREVFNDLDYPLIIAGMNPGKELKKEVENLPHIKLVNKIDTPGITELIRKAHINVLPTFQGTGMKLKLINVLFQGRHCIVNKKMVHNTGLESLCHIANTSQKMKQMVLKLAKHSFSESDIAKREAILMSQFSNSENTAVLLREISVGEFTYSI